MPRKPKSPVADDEHYFDSFEHIEVPPHAYAANGNPDFTPVDRKARIEDLDLKGELLKQFYDLQDLIGKNQRAPLNQQAQIANVLGTITSRIIANQQALHDIEKVKLIESVLIEVLQGFPDVRNAFIDKYEQELQNAERALAAGT